MFFKFINHKNGSKVQQLDSSYGRDPKTTSIPFITTISPPPPYATLFNRNMISANDPNSIQFPARTRNGTVDTPKNHKVINGRDYLVVKEQGLTRLIPMRAPSAALFQYRYTE